MSFYICIPFYRQYYIFCIIFIFCQNRSKACYNSFYKPKYVKFYAVYEFALTVLGKYVIVPKEIVQGETRLNRIDIIPELLKAHREATAATVNFLEKPRKYAENDTLYMREVHFVMEVGSADNLTMGDVARRLNVTQGAVTQMAVRMEKKGYVKRSKQSTDKRLTTISLTEKGKQLCENHVVYDRKEHQIISEILADFTDEELLKIIRYEQTMKDLFEAHL